MNETSEERWIPSHTCGDPDGLGICDACAAIDSYRGVSPSRRMIAAVESGRAAFERERAYCRACDLARHHCPGCGVDVPHGTVACAPCDAL